MHDLLQQLCTAWWSKDTKTNNNTKPASESVFPSVILFHINLWLAEKGDSDLKALTMFMLESWEISDFLILVYMLISDVISLFILIHFVQETQNEDYFQISCWGFLFSHLSCQNDIYNVNQSSIVSNIFMGKWMATNEPLWTKLYLLLKVAFDC